MNFQAPHPSTFRRGLRIVVVGIAVSGSISACSLGAATPNSRGAAGPDTQPPVPAPTSRAVFDNFTVTVSRVEDSQTAKLSLVEAKVCVTSLPKSYVGKRIRISWDPWSVTAGAQTAKPGYQGKAPTGVFRADSDYKVGGCASGLIPFEVTGNLDSVKYDNSLGDKATWDAATLELRPPN